MLLSDFLDQFLVAKGSQLSRLPPMFVLFFRLEAVKNGTKVIFNFLSGFYKYKAVHKCVQFNSTVDRL